MLYTGLCTDNSKYFTTGRISVRILSGGRIQTYTEDGTSLIRADDLSTETIGDVDITQTEVVVEGITSPDFSALVFTPLGGGRNFGLFSLPPINSKGVVTFLDGSRDKLLWLGSYFDATIADDLKTTDIINVPSVDPANDRATYTDRTTDRLRANDIVLRTRHTSIDDTYDWSVTHTENLIVVGDTLVRLRHISAWDGENQDKYQEIMIHKDGDNSDKETILLDVNNIGGDKRSYFRITEDGIRMTVIEAGDSTTFEVSVAGNAINFTDAFGNSIVGNEDGLRLTSGDGGAKEIHVHASGDGTIFLNGEDGTIVSLVTYDKLKTIVEAFRDHIHYGEVNSLKTTTPKNSNGGPISSDVDQPKTDMEANLLKTKEMGS